MAYYDNLVESRKGFVDQLSNLINSQFDIFEKIKENLEEFENNPEFIQKYL